MYNNVCAWSVFPLNCGKRNILMEKHLLINGSFMMSWMAGLLSYTGMKWKSLSF